MLRHAFWGLCASAVMLFILLAALGAFEPGEVEALTAGVLALAVLWLGHSWRELWRQERRG